MAAFDDELRSAVRRVIDQNLSIGYPPNRFIGETQNCRSIRIVEVCERLLTNPETLEHLEKPVRQYRSLLTLEDAVVNHPEGFGLSQSARNSAKARIEYFQQICPGRRS